MEVRYAQGELKKFDIDGIGNLRGEGADVTCAGEG